MSAAIPRFEQQYFNYRRASNRIEEQREFLANLRNLVDYEEQRRCLVLRAEYESARRQLQLDYDRLMHKRIKSAAIPQVDVRHGPQRDTRPAGSGGLVRIVKGAYYTLFGRLPRVRRLHPAWASMRHLIRIVDTTTSENMSAKVLVVAGSSGLADTIADHVQGLHAKVTLNDAVQGNLIRAFNEPPEFDICICSLQVSETRSFPDIVNAIVPCMRQGGKIVGFLSNLDLAHDFVQNWGLIEGMFAVRGLARVYYAGSRGSARAIRRLQRLTTGGGVFSRLRQMMTLFLVVAPAAWFANQAEAAVSEEQQQRPEICTSITVEVVV